MTAVMLLSAFSCQLLYPTVAMALTTGPSQPEVQAFEPVGTTDMVDMFSGSFVYNIPLLDVEGYPVNISYHGGVTMEQEASWVGLGWNINPGVINRAIRGIPDDFNGDTVYKELHIKPEKNVRVGVDVGGELFGSGDPPHRFGSKIPEGGESSSPSAVNADFNAGYSINISNYRGVSADLTFNMSLQAFNAVSLGVNIGVGSQSGATIDLEASVSRSTGIVSSAAFNSGYNSRSGYKDINLAIGLGHVKEGQRQRDAAAYTYYATIPIGVKNYVPVITNSSLMASVFGRIKLGGELFGIYGYARAHGLQSILTYKNDASRATYGYLYMQNANINDEDILDFTRDKDGMFNKSMQYLPVPNMTYDVYSLSGQGTGGMFRPYRNDFGSVYDPYTTSTNIDASVQAEAGGGNVFEAGADLSVTHTDIKSGPWNIFNRKGANGFKKNLNGSIFENVYFKQGGELTQVDSQYFTVINGKNCLLPQMAMALPSRKPGSDVRRDPRSNLIHYHTAEEADAIGVAADRKVLSHTDAGHTHPYNDAYLHVVDRIGSGPFNRKKDQIAEIVQVQKDGRKYVYGIAAMNNMQREATFSVEPLSGNSLNMNTGNITFSSSDADTTNSKGIDEYYSNSITPAYAHSYLLTSVLSTDYVDVSGDGVSDDDLGSFTKFKYTRTDSDFRWVTPYSSNFDSAQYSPGFWSDKRDDKAGFLCGSREQWYLHAIETKNYIAEFYTSPRSDAMGISKPVLGTSALSALLSSDKSSPSLSYKLDSIKLYNKHDRFVNGADAIPVKTVFFEYDYDLCQGLPNASSGKLTLKKLYFRYGNSQKTMISPYQFTYGFNPAYDYANKDRWGNYKPNNTNFTNWEFPYVNQNDPALNSYASAWSLTEISLPSGGVIKAEYEANDYAFVQDKPANEMFMVQGVGASNNFMRANQLYSGLTSPCLYLYFARRIASEIPTLGLAGNYMGKNFNPDSVNCIYFNFNVQLTSASSSFEQIKGYVNIKEIGKCPNDTTYGYLRLEPITPVGSHSGSLPSLSDLYLNPITYTALNTARYNLPQVIFPGQNPDNTTFENILKGLARSFEELITVGANPLFNLVVRGGGKNILMAKSFVRLHNIGMCKKGGGQRVKSLSFHDEWDILAGGNEHGTYYGKEYKYKTNDLNYGEISSGVASYEPLIGGDENPFRMPVRYTARSGSKFPPNDPVELYQETPIGESLFPSAQVGYSEVTVTSLHKNVGRSSKTLDKYEFYTAKDYPVQIIAPPAKAIPEIKNGIFNRKNMLTVTQPYVLIFNDMHGKQKKTTHSIYNLTEADFKPVAYQAYHYKRKNGQLDNKVDCFVYTGSDFTIRKLQLGVEEDVTIDTREKTEKSTTFSISYNSNGFLLPIIIPIPIVIPLIFSWPRSTETRFQSAVASKVIQQYGILESIESFNEGALTTTFNEVYDGLTGQPVVTSVNNEFKDKEYTTNIPAWWVYDGMSGAYTNIGYKDAGSITINADRIGTLHISNSSPLFPGDYLSVHFKDASGVLRHTTAWIMGKLPTYSSEGISTCEGLQVLPHFPTNTPGWVAGTTLNDVTVKVISSGHKNQLDEIAQTFSATVHPAPSGSTTFDSLLNLIDISAKTFADSNTRMLQQHIQHPDSMNPYAMGVRGQWRQQSEYAYHANRTYGTPSSRTEGLFCAGSLFKFPSSLPSTCVPPVFNFLHFVTHNPNWRPMRTITKWSPFGNEVENVDAIGNYSTAVFAYNEQFPVAVASNARQGEVLSLGFEDNNLLYPVNNYMDYNHFPIIGGAAGSLFMPYQRTFAKIDVNASTGHTGTNCLHPTDVQGTTWYLPIQEEHLDTGSNKYNTYFSSSPITGAGYEFTPNNAYLSFALRKNKTYTMNFWLKQDDTGPFNVIDYSFASAAEIHVYAGSSPYVNYPSASKTNLIDGWQQREIRFNVPSDAYAVEVVLPLHFYADDIRVFPEGANMKAFVYAPVNKFLRSPNGRLMATLDENNFATMYEYDAEGNLVRVKKETAKGIMTVSESRQGNPKKNP